MTKLCKICGKEKLIDEFYFRNDIDEYRNECKECYKKKKREFYYTREERLKAKKDEETERLEHKNQKKCLKCGEWKKETEFYRKKEGIRARCKECVSNYSKSEEFKNKRNKVVKKRRDGNLEFYREKEKYYRENNKEEVKKRASKWKKENPEKIKFYRRKLERRKLKEVPVFKLKKNISRALLQYLKVRKGGRTTEKLIGESFLSIKIYLEKQFNENMSWGNYGNYWQIDHVIPQSLYDFTNENEIQKCWNKQNLRPLERKENLKKSNKIDMVVIKEKNIENLLPNNF